MTTTRPQHTSASLADQIAQHRADLAQIGQLVAAMPGADRDQINLVVVPNLAKDLLWLELHARSHQPKRLDQ